MMGGLRTDPWSSSTLKEDEERAWTRWWRKGGGFSLSARMFNFHCFSLLIYKSLSNICWLEDHVSHESQPSTSVKRNISFLYKTSWGWVCLLKDGLTKKQPPANLSGDVQVEELQVSASCHERQSPSNASHRGPRPSLTVCAPRGAFLTVFSQSVEVSLACGVSSLVLVSRGGALVDSWGIWRRREPRCPVCRSPCRWPSSRRGPRLCPPRWRWRTHGGSSEPPPEIARGPWGQRGGEKVVHL